VAVKDIAARLALDPATVTPLLKRLEALGYVERARSADDERVVNVRLTPDGAALKAKARSVPADLFCAMRQTPEFLVRLRADLKQLHDALSADTDC